MTEMQTLTIGTQTYVLVDGKAIHFNAPQDLSPEEKAQALDNIGAAPAGYGLGKQNEVIITSLSELDNTYLNGWYKFQTFNEENIEGHKLGLLYVNSSTSSVEQIFVPYRNPHRLIRVLHAEDGWGVWEYENPPMVLGVEYRTTERWQNKPVYTKLIDFGYIPGAAGEKRVSVEIPEWPDISIVDVNGVIYNPNENTYFSLNAPKNITAYIYDGKIIIESETSRTHQTAKILVKYIKL